MIDPFQCVSSILGANRYQSALITSSMSTVLVAICALYAPVAYSNATEPVRSLTTPPFVKSNVVDPIPGVCNTLSWPVLSNSDFICSMCIGKFIGTPVQSAPPEATDPFTSGNGATSGAGLAEAAYADGGVAGLGAFAEDLEDERGAVDHPWVFREARARLAGDSAPPPTDDEK